MNKKSLFLLAMISLVVGACSSPSAKRQTYVEVGKLLAVKQIERDLRLDDKVQLKTIQGESFTETEWDVDAIWSPNLDGSLDNLQTYLKGTGGMITLTGGFGQNIVIDINGVKSTLSVDGNGVLVDSVGTKYEFRMLRLGSN